MGAGYPSCLDAFVQIPDKRWTMTKNAKAKPEPKSKAETKAGLWRRSSSLFLGQLHCPLHSGVLLPSDDIINIIKTNFMNLNHFQHRWKSSWGWLSFEATEERR